MSHPVSDADLARRASRAELVTRLFILLLLGLLVAAAVTILQIRATQVTNTKKNDKTALTLAVVKDCTQPSGKCYQRGQKQTANVLGQLERIIILSAACAADVSTTRPVDQRITAITSCVTQRLTQPEQP